MEHAVIMRDIVKIYPETGLRANDEVSLHLNKGEILCLAGENGAGKTTLMKILYGMERPDAGSISVCEKEVVIHNPLEANRLGIGMVHQHFMLFDDFTVAQNVVMGKEPTNYHIAYNHKKALTEVQKVIEKHHFSIEASKKVGSLTVGQKQQTEIVKMLYRDVDVLILDEPTAVLTEQEIEALFVTLKTLAAQGKSLILITHKLHEIRAISDRVAIMRQGRMVGEYPTSSLEEREISHLMMGQSVSLYVKKDPVTVLKKPIIAFESVSVIKKNQERPLLDAVSFTSYSGEILGFAGVGGNGLGELEAVLGGLLPISQGKIFHKEVEITKSETAVLRKKGLAYVPADRLHLGSALRATVTENMIINERSSFSTFGAMNKKSMVSYTEEKLKNFSIKGSPFMPIGMLSGGNIQKVILAREFSNLSDYMVFSEPTWGLDIASSHFVYEHMIALRKEGKAVILLSSNLDEVLALSDRVIIMCRGKIAAVLTESEIQQVSKEELGAYMLGSKQMEEKRGTPT